MCQKIHEIFADSNKMGHQDIFLSYPEIRRSNLLVKSPQDRPDLCARIFNLKLTVSMEKQI